jgi:NTE family protein
MNYQRSKSTQSAARKQLPFECVALVLQGGGALGSYQAGVYEALAAADLHPDWIAGISIGAINAAIIAGNAPNERVAKLKTFWETVTANPLLDWTAMADAFMPQGNLARSIFTQMSAGFSLTGGANEFFTLRQPAPYFQPGGTKGALSYYDNSKLKSTLERLVDFDRLNNDGMRLSVGAVNIRTGNFVYFDTTEITIRPEHIIASGSLPPGFPPTEIDGEFYWDGGLVSNTPLQWVVDGGTRQDTLAFQIDLWPAQGNLPRNIAEVTTRQKEIQYSSRTRAATDQFKRMQNHRCALSDLLENLPPEMQKRESTELLKKVADHKIYNIVHLIYRSRQYETDSKDFDFSRLSMQEHWQSGLEDARRTLERREIFERPQNHEGVLTFDFLKQDAP